ncbi:MAG: hypothetical protein CMD16_00200 [Flavobacteriales bacterium]|nr:hypothetical protein [Flavobacteriales bacterium]|tara:strand:+ start:7804 stop:8022 length:219 start_codon:yes stop_codon:yes gene_type:complete
MNKHWTKIFSSNDHVQIEIIKQMLEENDLSPVILNKQDSSYNMFGTIDLYIIKKDQKKAIKLLKENNNERNT